MCTNSPYGNSPPLAWRFQRTNQICKCNRLHWVPKWSWQKTFCTLLAELKSDHDHYSRQITNDRLKQSLNSPCFFFVSYLFKIRILYKLRKVNIVSTWRNDFGNGVKTVVMTSSARRKLQRSSSLKPEEDWPGATKFDFLKLSICCSIPNHQF